MMIWTKFYFDFKDGSLILGIEPDSESIVEFADISTFPSDIAPHEFEMCCNACQYWLPDLISRLQELGKDSRTICSTTNCLKMDEFL